MSIPLRNYLPGVLLLISGCGQSYREPSLSAPPQVPIQGSQRDTLKVHMRSGELYILANWHLSESRDTLVGSGSRYDVWRASTHVDTARIATGDVALLEATTRRTAVTFGTVGMGVMTTLGATISAICLMDPKGCFGSCPTFYVEGADTSRVHAEGFSSSVARVLEARDIDALDVNPTGRTLAIRMRNEALETHLVRRVSLLTVPRPRGGRVFASGDSLFYSATRVVPLPVATPRKATAARCSRRETPGSGSPSPIRPTWRPGKRSTCASTKRSRGRAW